MSKRLLAVSLALGILATSNAAFASRARLLVMGTGDAGAVLGNSISNTASGSFYYDDAYNMFYNPAYVNDFKNWATIEKSNFSGTTAQDFNGDGDTTDAFESQALGTSAMGGFVTSFMNFNIGFFANRTEAITGTYANLDDMRPWDLIIGGDMGVKWGLGATFASNDTGAVSDQDITLKGGVSVADFEPFVNFKVQGKTDATAAALGGTAQKNKSMLIGTRYHWGEWTPFAAWRQEKLENTKTWSGWGIGFGRNSKLSDMARLHYTVGYWRNTQALSRTSVPLNMAVEADLASWVTARAGFGFMVYDQVGGASVADTTFGRVGGTFHFGKLDLDWALGQVAPGAGAEAAGAADAQTWGMGSGMVTALGATYHW